MSTDAGVEPKKDEVKRRQDAKRSLKPLEHFRTVLRSLPWPDDAEGNKLRTLAVTSCRRREGVSTTAAQVAAAAAGVDASRVVLIDANARAPSVHRTFRIKRSPGFAEFVRNQKSLAECIKHAGDLAILTAGRTTDEASDVYDSPLMMAKLTELVDYFDLVVLDLPPAGSDSAAIKLAGMCDGTLLVVESEKTDREVAFRTRQLLDRSKAHLLGAVLNKRTNVLPKWLYG